MLKIWHSFYRLEPVTQLGAVASTEPRHGALLKVQWPEGKVGYADLFPWPEFGDVDVQTQLIAIGQGRLTTLVEQSIWMALRDADFRVEKRNAFQGLPRVKNHFLISDVSRIDDVTLHEAKSSGFGVVKVKVGRDWKSEVKWIERFLKQHTMMIRLDFNGTSNYTQVQDFLASLPLAFRARIEYIEDPFPFEEHSWKALNELVPLALDQEFEKVNWDKIKAPLPFKVLVIKPARQDVKKATALVNKFNLKMVVGSSLDHPVGVAHAVWTAGNLKKFYPNVLLDCGCLSLRAYKITDYSAEITTQGPYLTAIPGLGVGFDNLLEKTTWIQTTAGI